MSVLRGHASEVWCLAVSSVADFVVTGGHDRSLRVWAQTEQLLFPESEKQKELDLLFAPSPHELQQQVATEPAEMQVTAEGEEFFVDGISLICLGKKKKELFRAWRARLRRPGCRRWGR